MKRATRIAAWLALIAATTAIYALAAHIATLWPNP